MARRRFAGPRGQLSCSDPHGYRPDPVGFGLVNNAGIFRFAGTVETDQATFDAHIDVNLRAPFLLVQALAPAMATRGRGAVINISSGAAAAPGFGTGIYGASKAALESLTRVWAAEFGSAGVRVNAVAAGPTRTEGTAAYGAAFQAAAKSVALQRLAEAEEIAGAVAFLASDAASYVNGTTLDAIGGLPAVG
ncbi:SDR family oxidoreductase [Amycolatopsis sp. NPDC051061]|uniref:SDR family NAD(P)-dependent oxidoreductase n=1 Tax=Amycolatopsis sp. NPDC051061 TaxID=3155042 RepID=UPI00343AB80F